MPQALHLDQYSLTMGQYYYRENMNDLVSFEMFVRSLPPNRGYLIAAGLGTALWYLRRLHFTREDIDFLASQEIEGYELPSKKMYNKDFLQYLRNMDFSCDVWAVPEGTPVFPYEPILRVTGPRIEATLVEALLLSIINHQTMIASKARRIVDAAAGRAVWDFSLRRLHGPEASLGVARAAYIAGCAGTATVEAGRILKIPTTGTMAHAQIMCEGPGAELTVFEKVLQNYPDKHALLVDTYDTKEGVLKAIAASLNTSIPLGAIRIDSDVPAASRTARELLEDAAHEGPRAWFKNTKIIASNDLDEYQIAKLQNHPIDSYGVGTMLGTSADAPNLGGVYKLVEQHEREPRYVMKHTIDKQTDPGCHQLYRTTNGDYLSLDDAPLSAPEMMGTPLLEQVMENGRIPEPLPSLDDAQYWCQNALDFLPDGIRDLEEPEMWPFIRSPSLCKLITDIREGSERKYPDGLSPQEIEEVREQGQRLTAARRPIKRG